MSNARRGFTGVLAAGALAAVLAAGCSSEDTSFTLGVTATPNPVAGTGAGIGRRWDFEVAITNTSAVGMHVENFHTGISGTDTGYDMPLVLVKESGIIGEYVRSGATLRYSANRESDGYFARGRERRIYHCLGDDGVYYSGEVTIDLQ
jgi:hypothetical protein